MLSEKEIVELAKIHGTPLYIFDKDELFKRVQAIQDMLGKDITLCYAMKANPFLVDAMKTLQTKFEVCSPGEFAICEREKVDRSFIVLSGVYKAQSDMDYILDQCSSVGIYTIESVKQFEMLNLCAKKRNITLSVLLRVTSGNQFGLDETEIEKLIANRFDYPWINFLGIQCYTGTQKNKMSVITKELQWLDSFCDRLKERYGFTVRELEYGPGLMVSYFGKDAYNNHLEMLGELKAALESIKNKYHITLEMGRYLAATCGIYVSKVVDTKVNLGQSYCIIDGGINHINYYGQTLAMKVPAYAYVQQNGTVVKAFEWREKDNAEKWTICGSLCTAADVIVKNLPIGKPQQGDFIIFYNIGAYAVTEGIYLFLSRMLPKIIAVCEKSGVELYRDFQYSDIINSRQILFE